MRRSWWSRSFAAIFAVWFAFLVAEPLTVMHQCPMHDGVMAMQNVGDVGPMHHVDMHGSAHHGSATHEHSVPGSHDPAHHTGHQCTCIGDCAGVATVGLPVQRAAFILAIETAATRDTGLPDYAYIPVAIQHLLPFQNGPPGVPRVA